MMDTMKVSDQVVFEDNVMEKIVGKTAREVEGILDLRGGVIDNIKEPFKDDQDPKAGVDIDMDEDEKTVEVTVDAILEYGRSAEKVLTTLAKRVKEEVMTMTGYTVIDLKLVVKDMLTKTEWQAKNEKKPEPPKPESDRHHDHDHH